MLKAECYLEIVIDNLENFEDNTVNVKSRCIFLLRFWCNVANDNVNNTMTIIDFVISSHSL